MKNLLLITAATFLLSNMAFSQSEWKPEPIPTNIIKDSYESPKPRSDCDQINNFTATFVEEEKAVYLEWEEPSNRITWSRSPLWGTIATCYCDFIVATRFTPTDLEALGVITGHEITKIGFVPYYDTVTTITIQIYDGGSVSALPMLTNSGTLRYEQAVVTETLIEKVYNEVILDTPFHQIDASKELWIALRISTSLSGWISCALDTGPRIVDKGDLLRDITTPGWWTDVYSVSGGEWSCNWNIDAFITDPNSTFSYNIYRGDNLIVSNSEDLNYVDDVTEFDMGDYEYCIVAVSPDCESERACRDVSVQWNSVDEYSHSVRLYPNPTTGELRIENGELKIENIEIYTIVGQKQKTIFNFQFSTFNSIDISHLPAGVYFVKITTEKSMITKKIIKY